MAWIRTVILSAALVGNWGVSTAIAQPASTGPSKAITIADAFQKPTEIADNATSFQTIAPGQTPFVKLKDEELLAIPVVVTASNTRTAVIRSYVTRLPSGEHVLFYPLLTVIGDDFSIQQTLKPKYEFAFEGTRLVNEFELPKGASRFLVHTSPEYFRSSFTGITSTGSSPSGGAYGVAGALGGAVGALILHLATTGESHEFRFGELGNLEIAVQ